MIYPSKLRKNDVIRIISPSDGTNNNKISELDKAINYLKRNDFEVQEDKYVRCSINGASANYLDRAKELNKSFIDKESKALIACSGGNYLTEILNYVNFNKFINNIKWVQGHSDITNLLYYITTNYDIATIYSFNVRKFRNDFPKKMLENDIEYLRGNTPIQYEFNKWECINTFNVIEGRIIGGCIECLKEIIGTKFDKTKKFLNKYKDEGIVWYFDVFNMTNEEILLTLLQFKNAGWFKYCKGILFGTLTEEKSYTGITLKDAINKHLNDLNIPILINVDFGHNDPKITIINGSIIKISNDKKYILETFFR